jgi:hypothetical protein
MSSAAIVSAVSFTSTRGRHEKFMHPTRSIIARRGATDVIPWLVVVTISPIHD